MAPLTHGVEGANSARFSTTTARFTARPASSCATMGGARSTVNGVGTSAGRNRRRHGSDDGATEALRQEIAAREEEICELRAALDTEKRK